MKIIYQKRNGEIIERIRNTYCPYRVGDTTSMGWKVVDILYPYKNKYYHSGEYSRLINKEIKRDVRMIHFKKAIKETIKNVNYGVNILLLFKLFIFISNKAILATFL